MPINFRPDDEPKLTTWGHIKAVAITVSVIVLLSVGYGNWVHDTNLKHCIGEYNTPQCKIDRAKEKERAYERAKQVQ